MIKNHSSSKVLGNAMHFVPEI